MLQVMRGILFLNSNGMKVYQAAQSKNDDKIIEAAGHGQGPRELP